MTKIESIEKLLLKAIFFLILPYQNLGIYLISAIHR